MGMKQNLHRLKEKYKGKKMAPAFNALHTFLYTPNEITHNGTHIKAVDDLKRTMNIVILALVPCLIFGIFNAGYQHYAAVAAAQGTPWTPSLFENFLTWDNFVMGAWTVLPLVIVSYGVGLAVEFVFAVIKGHEVEEGYLVTGMLVPLIVPVDIPLWMLAIAVIFGVVIGKEVFGGTGKNFLNPALTGRAFLYFAYPAQLSGDSVWVPVDGFTGATALAVSASDGFQELAARGMSWWDSFYGFVPGSMGETSTLACLIGLAFLLFTKIANYRMVVGCMAGMIGFSLLLNWIGSDTNPMFAMPWYWHLVLGGYAFGLVFMVTEPVSGAHTNMGRYIYGALIGFMVVMIRVINPAFPEGMMLAILFGNVFAPLIDYFVVQANIKRRAKRNA